jgi:YfiH family protein
MLHPRRGPDDLLYYTSPLLEAAQILHAFSTRQGGVSLPPFHSLNLGISRDSTLKDSPAKIEINYQRLSTAIGCQDRTRTWVSQVHGRDICEIHPGQIFANGASADALITDDPARSLSIKYADCVPILLATPDGRAVAAVHAGWRGLVSGIIGAAVRRIELFTQSPAATFIAAIGPCICRDHFEVGPEVLTAFDELLNPAAAPKKYTEKGHVDLAQTTRHLLQSAGVQSDHIDTAPLCTYENPAEFYSHRRDGPATGRMAAIISPREPQT